MPTCRDSALNRALGIESREFPGGPGVRAGHFPSQGPRFNPWSGN